MGKIIKKPEGTRGTTAAFFGKRRDPDSRHPNQSSLRGGKDKGDKKKHHKQCNKAAVPVPIHQLSVCHVDRRPADLGEPTVDSGFHISSVDFFVDDHLLVEEWPGQLIGGFSGIYVHR